MPDLPYRVRMSTTSGPSVPGSTGKSSVLPSGSLRVAVLSAMVVILSGAEWTRRKWRVGASRYGKAAGRSHRCGRPPRPTGRRRADRGARSRKRRPHPPMWGRSAPKRDQARGALACTSTSAVRGTGATSHRALDQQFLDVVDGFGGIEVLRANIHAVHDGMAT